MDKYCINLLCIYVRMLIGEICDRVEKERKGVKKRYIQHAIIPTFTPISLYINICDGFRQLPVYGLSGLVGGRVCNNKMKTQEKKSYKMLPSTYGIISPSCSAIV